MERHTKEYFTKLNLDPYGWNPCELCGKTLVDVHHLVPRSHFGSKRKNTEPGNQDHIDNLLGVCRTCHDEEPTLNNPNVIKALEARKLHIGLI